MQQAINLFEEKIVDEQQTGLSWETEDDDLIPADSFVFGNNTETVTDDVEEEEEDLPDFHPENIVDQPASRSNDFEIIEVSPDDIRAQGMSLEGVSHSKLTSPESGISLEVYTNEPGIQVYTGNFLDGTAKGKKGIVYNHRRKLPPKSGSFRNIQ